MKTVSRLSFLVSFIHSLVHLFTCSLREYSIQARCYSMRADLKCTKGSSGSRTLAREGKLPRGGFSSVQRTDIKTAYKWRASPFQGNEGLATREINNLLNQYASESIGTSIRGVYIFTRFTFKFYILRLSCMLFVRFYMLSIFWGDYEI